MIDGASRVEAAPRRQRSISLWIAGLLSLALFFVPLVAPFLQLMTLAFVAAALRRRATDASSLAIAAGGALLGLALHLLTQYVWIV